MITITLLIILTLFAVFNRFQNYKEIWSIAIFGGDSILTLHPGKDIKTPILTASDVTDIDAEFLADPFIAKSSNGWNMFFEIWDKKANKGVIGLATSTDLKTWVYQKVVLEECFHLSYPYVFQWNNEWFMLPPGNGYLYLYKAAKFPYQWEMATHILRGSYADSSIFRYNNTWWILTSKNENKKYDNLRLFYSEDLMTGWKEHPKSPLITNNDRITRGGGRVMVDGNSVIRFAQDDHGTYGQRVRAFEILQLSNEEYKETELGIVIEASDKPGTWNQHGMHTIDAIKCDGNNYIAVVDGKFHKQYNRLTDKLILKFGRLFMLRKD